MIAPNGNDKDITCRPKEPKLGIKLIPPQLSRAGNGGFEMTIAGQKDVC